MSQYHWENCLPEVKQQVNHFVYALKEILADNLTGIYLHGSLAMGCFNPQSSDIDILAATHQPIAPDARWALAELFLSLSNKPRPLEVSFLNHAQLAAWQHPTLYDLHYSEDWRARYQSCLDQRSWDSWPASDNLDNDLAAHITITQHRGICLYGQPIPQTFPQVPAQDYFDSIVSDFHWANERITENPVYTILNACRVLAFEQEGCIYSKEEGGVWALAQLPPKFHALVLVALNAYRGEEQADFNPLLLQRFMNYMNEQIEHTVN